MNGNMDRVHGARSAPAIGPQSSLSNSNSSAVNVGDIHLHGVKPSDAPQALGKALQRTASGVRPSRMQASPVA
jgi:hypothetical protein